MPEDDIPPEIREAIVQYLTAIAEKRCPACGMKVEKEEQVGRCVYAKPCGHRMYQGRARKKKS